VNENAEIVVFERGPYVSFANCGLPYYIAGEIRDQSQLLVASPETFWNKYRVRVKTQHEVQSIDREAKTVQVLDLISGLSFAEPYDQLILAQGAKPIEPPIDGLKREFVFTLRDIPDMLRIDDYVRKHDVRRAVVVGGGFIGLEMAEAFNRRGIHVDLVERSSHVMSNVDTDLAESFQVMMSKGQDLCLHLDSSMTSVEEGAIVLDHKKRIETDLVLVSIGVRPEVEIAREAGIELGQTGGVMVNGRMESSDPDIYAVGDAAETVHRLTGQRVRIPLAGPANRQGRVAGTNAVGGHVNYKGALGTAIVRMHSATLAVTGLSQSQIEASGLSYFKSTTKDLSHAGYYPGAKAITTRLFVEEGTGRLLGAQVLGEDGVDKRIDVLATSIAAGMKVEDLDDLDLAYSPPFGSAIDPVNTAGRVAHHIQTGELRVLQPGHVASFEGQVVDVREESEWSQGHVKGAKHIPLATVRDRLDELDRDRPVMVYCQKGLRGYIASRVLQQHGFDVANLSGGFAQLSESSELV
jgi:NADPH-dependent 2,4-dienoyl-CoA reductase/sulfur reductase-like enzyme/rhodanese-related sulfurtransferase